MKCKVCGKNLSPDSKYFNLGIGPECYDQVKHQFVNPKDRSEQSIESSMEHIIEVSVRVQKFKKDAIPTGGTMASYYANHRVSYDVDHLLLKMTEEVDELLGVLSNIKGWRAKKESNVIILGKLDGVEVGFRQMFRKTPIKTQIVKTKNGDWEVPTIDEVTGFKAIMTAKRNAVRDYLDFAALSETINDETKVLEILMGLNEGYDVDWSYHVSRSLIDSAPSDKDEVDLNNYKNLSEKYKDWNYVSKVCQKYGKLLQEALLKESK